MKTKLHEIVMSMDFRGIRYDFNTVENQYMLKFFDPLYVKRAINIVELLGLHKKKKMRIFDIGSGFAYFPYLCRELGHDVVISDTQEPLYDAVTKYLGFEKISLTVRAFEKMNMPGRFDCVTALKAAFHQKDDGDWGSVEWDFFYSDLREHLNPRAIVYITGSNSMDPYHRSGDKQHLFNGGHWKIK